MQSSSLENMRRARPFTAVSVVVFTVVALMHVLRLLQRWEVVINGVAVPMWVSVAGLAIAGGLAVMLWREARS